MVGERRAFLTRIPSTRRPVNLGLCPANSMSGAEAAPDWLRELVLVAEQPAQLLGGLVAGTARLAHRRQPVLQGHEHCRLGGAHGTARGKRHGKRSHTDVVRHLQDDEQVLFAEGIPDAGDVAAKLFDASPYTIGDVLGVLKLCCPRLLGIRDLVQVVRHRRSPPHESTPRGPRRGRQGAPVSCRPPGARVCPQGSVRRPGHPY